jgi:hypothetical protein
VTHLQASYELVADPETRNARVQQVQELSQFIAAKVKSPETSDIAILGDFNMDPLQSPKEYEEFMDALSVITKLKFDDALFTIQKKHLPTTVPYWWDAKTNSEVVLDSYLTFKNYHLPIDGEEEEDLLRAGIKRVSCRLDYSLFSLNSSHWTVHNAVVEPFALDNTGGTDESPKCFQVSDHMGIVTSLTCKK